MLEMKCKLYVNGIREEIIHCGNVDTTGIKKKTLDVELLKLSEGELISVNEEKSLVKKMKVSQRRK